MINTELLISEYNKLDSKLSEISSIKKLWGGGSSFEGVEIDDEGVYYRTSDQYNGCSPDFYSFFVKWEEINEPIEFFKEKYAKEIEDDKIKKQIKSDADKKAREEKELIELKRLQQKYKEQLEETK